MASATLRSATWCVVNAWMLLCVSTTSFAQMKEGAGTVTSELDRNSLVLVIAALMLVAFAFVGAVFVMRSTAAETRDLEVLKARFAQVTFAGILVLFIFTSLLYMASPNGPGKEIFDKALAAVTGIAGVIIGYYFGSERRAAANGNEGAPITRNEGARSEAESETTPGPRP